MNAINVCRWCGGKTQLSPKDDVDFLPKPNARRCEDCGRLVNSTTVNRTVEELSAAIDKAVTEMPDCVLVRR